MGAPKSGTVRFSTSAAVPQSRPGAVDGSRSSVSGGRSNSRCTRSSPSTVRLLNTAPSWPAGIVMVVSFVARDDGVDGVGSAVVPGDGATFDSDDGLDFRAAARFAGAGLAGAAATGEAGAGVGAGTGAAWGAAAAASRSVSAIPGTSRLLVIILPPAGGSGT